MGSAREAAFQALSSFRKSGAFPQNALDAAIRRSGLDARDAALSQKICRGVLRNMQFLDWHIARASGRDCSRISGSVLDVLRLSLYQILFLERVPVHSAVNEGVLLVRRHAGQAAAGFANAVLRRLAREKDALPPVRCDSEAETLATRWSHPLWLVEEYLRVLGEEGCRRLLEKDAGEPDITFQINTLRAGDGTAAELLAAGAQPHPWLPDAFVASGIGNPADLGVVKRGEVWIQDAAARAAVLAMDLRPGMFVMDVCASPGGKAFAAASDMRGQGRIIASDLSEKKAARIREGADRLGMDIIRTEVRDASVRCGEYAGKADAVIADVPCSGFGTLRKNPDARYKDPDAVRRLPAVQGAILSNVADYVRPGGVLLYSTCTLLEAENESVVRSFLGMRKDFVPEPFCVCGHSAPEGFLTFWPHITDSDGFFAAKLRRVD